MKVAKASSSTDGMEVLLVLAGFAATGTGAGELGLSMKAVMSTEYPAIINPATDVYSFRCASEFVRRRN